MITHLTVLYDERCGFCVRCARWLGQQRTHVRIWLLPTSSETVAKRFPGLHRATDELTVIDSDGGVYRGANAWILCLWAMVEWRAWSVRLASPTLKPVAREAFELLSTNRHHFSRLLRLNRDDVLARRLRAEVDPASHPRCSDGSCAHEAPTPP